MNHEKYRLILENMISGIAVFEPDADQDDFIITEFNKAACKIENVIPENVIGKNLRNVFPNPDKAGLINAVKRVHLTGVSERYAVKDLCKKEISAWINHSIFKISTGEVVSVFRDETERKMIEQSLKESEQRLSLCSTAMGSFCQIFVKISNKFSKNVVLVLKICGHTNLNFILYIYWNTCFLDGHVCT